MAKYINATCINCDNQFTFNNTGATYIQRRYCKDCRDEIVVANRKNRHDATLAKNALVVKDVHRVWAVASLKNHKRIKHDVDITEDELTTLAKQTPSCELCGCHLTYNGGANSPHIASMDRILNGDTYTVKQVGILCRRCNGLKGNMPFEQFLKFLEGGVRYARKIVPDFSP